MNRDSGAHREDAREAGVVASRGHLEGALRADKEREGARVSAESAGGRDAHHGRRDHREQTVRLREPATGTDRRAAEPQRRPQGRPGMVSF